MSLSMMFSKVRDEQAKAKAKPQQSEKHEQPAQEQRGALGAKPLESLRKSIEGH